MPKSTTKTIPSPYSGWNTRDPLSDMKPTHAITLDNWFPQTDKVTTRQGSESYATGFDGVPETLIEYSSGTSTKFFAVSAGNIYDISAAGATGSAVYTGLTNNRLQHANFGNVGAQWVIAVNGTNTPIKYDGSTWSTTAITGPADSTKLIGVNVYKSRLWFVEDGTLSMWYMPLYNIAGAATKLDLSPLCKKGGYIMACATWSFDGFAGPQDYILFITSKGEVLMYSGADPTDSTLWGIVGTFVMGEPVGRRCVLKLGGDIIIITEEGFQPVSQFSRTDQTKPQVAITDIIKPTVLSDVASYGTVLGWEGHYYPKAGQLLFNIPTLIDQTAKQYVMNTITGAWCSFSGMNAATWGMYNRNLYFGALKVGGTNTLWDTVQWDTVGWADSPVVYKADTGTADAAVAITATVETAFTGLGNPERVKRMSMIRPQLSGLSVDTATFKLNMDYDRSSANLQTLTFSVIGAVWDQIYWDTTLWAGDTFIIQPWQTASGIGNVTSLYMVSSSAAFRQGWTGTIYMFEPGGLL